MTSATQSPAVALLFDLDGVLIDSQASQDRAWKWWCQQHNLEPDPFLNAHGMTGREKIASLVPAALGLCPLTEAAMITTYEIDDSYDVTAYEGAAVMLTSFECVAVVTSADTRLAEARLAAARLTKPEVLIGADMVECGKPNPDPYLLAADKLGIKPEQCIAFEDAPAGVTSAKGAGMYVVAVTTTVEASYLQHADAIVANLIAFLDYLERAWHVTRNLRNKLGDRCHTLTTLSRHLERHRRWQPVDSSLTIGGFAGCSATVLGGGSCPGF
jgi:mannitol-1-/sugar-/sorbitol-6-phosphatase